MLDNTAPAINNWHWRPCRNEAGVAIPAFAALHAYEVDTDNGTYRVVAPLADDAPVFFNGPFGIPEGGYGNITYTIPAVALFATDDGTPAFGEEWGSVAGDFRLRKNHTGYTILGGVVGDRVTVVRTGGGGGGPAPFVGVRLTHTANDQTVPPGVSTPVFFGIVQYATGDLTHDPPNGIITVNSPGVYRVSFSLRMWVNAPVGSFNAEAFADVLNSDGCTDHKVYPPDTLGSYLDWAYLIGSADPGFPSGGEFPRNLTLIVRHRFNQPVTVIQPRFSVIKVASL